MAHETLDRGLLELLAWYGEIGLDGVVADTPVNWLERGGQGPGHGFELAEPAAAPIRAAPAGQSVAPPLPVAPRAPANDVPRPVAAAPQSPGPRASLLPPGGTPAPASPRAFPVAAPDASVMAARQAARHAATLDDLGRAIAAFDGCGLKATAKSLCFYRGAPAARLMIVGEAPGRDEDLAGKPFVGPAGQLLDRMLAAIALTEADVHITNTVYWRPPGNRPPTTQEVEACRPFLERQMQLVAPDILLLLGGPATQALLGSEERIMKARGRWREIDAGGRAVKVMPTLHPAYLLRTPAAKRQVWRDLLAIREMLD